MRCIPSLLKHTDFGTCNTNKHTHIKLIAFYLIVSNLRLICIQIIYKDIVDILNTFGYFGSNSAFPTSRKVLCPLLFQDVYFYRIGSCQLFTNVLRSHKRCDSIWAATNSCLALGLVLKAQVLKNVLIRVCTVNCQMAGRPSLCRGRTMQSAGKVLQPKYGHKNMWIKTTSVRHRQGAPTDKNKKSLHNHPDTLLAISSSG